MSQGAYGKSIITHKANFSPIEIYIAGDYGMALEALRKWCSEDRDCWSVQRIDYVYTGGQEAGVKLTRIDYPRFPMVTGKELHDRGMGMAHYMLQELHQSSCTLFGPMGSAYISRKKHRE